MKTLHFFLMSLGALVVFLLSFSFYTYDSAVGDAPPGPPLQLSRIDFQSDVDSLTGAMIRHKVKHLEGVTHTYFNLKDDILVFSHDPKTIEAKHVLEGVETEFNIPATRFEVTKAMAASACPVTGSNSVFMRIGGYLHRLF
jgi:hypothetical protein